MILTKSTPGPDNLHCRGDANNEIAFQGDYCSNDEVAGRMHGQLLARGNVRGVGGEINDVSGDPLCNGGTSGDARAD